MQQKILLDKKTYIKIFQTAIQERKTTISEISQKTKIQETSIKKIISADFSDFRKVTISNYIKSICKELKLKSNHFIIFAEQETEHIPDKQILYPKKFDKILENKFLIRILYTFSIFLSTIFIIIFIGFQIKSFIEKPKINIISPNNNEVFSYDVIKIYGTTCEKCSVSINGKNVSVGQSGEFEKTLKLVEGKNIIFISSRSELGRSNEKKISIFYKKNKN